MYNSAELPHWTTRPSPRREFLLTTRLNFKLEHCGSRQQFDTLTSGDVTTSSAPGAKIVFIGEAYSVLVIGFKVTENVKISSDPRVSASGKEIIVWSSPIPRKVIAEVGLRSSSFCPSSGPNERTNYHIVIVIFYFKEGHCGVDPPSRRTTLFSSRRKNYVSHAILLLAPVDLSERMQ